MRIELGIPLSLSQISEAIGGRLLIKESPVITHITTDSREVANGDLFIPVKGERFNGADYIPDAIKKGCFAISPYPIRGHILLPDYSSALLDLASFYSKKLPFILYKIGITGSVGKTTTKEFLKILLSTEYKVHASAGNFNNEIGLPISILSAPYDSQILLMEMGMNHKGEICRLSKCLRPNIGIITNIGSAHIGNLGSRKAIAEAKLEIRDGMSGGRIYVPFEEELLFNIENRIDVSLKNESANYYLESIGKEITVYKNQNICLQTTFGLEENHHRQCLLFAIAVATDAGVSSKNILSGISQISGENTRQRVIKRENFLFFTDFYNASPESVLASIDSVKKSNLADRKSLMLGDILELGDLSDEIHLEVGRNISPEAFCSIFLFGSRAKLICKGAMENGFLRENIHINEDLSRPDLSADQIRKYCHSGEMILMKASRGVGLERVLDLFAK